MVELAVPVAPATDDPTFGGLVEPGETVVAALKRIERRPDSGAVIASEAGQRLLEAANRQARDARAGKGRKLVAVPEAPADDVDRGPHLVELDLDLVDIGENVRINVADLAELAASIREHGVLQPIRVIGPTHEGRYRVVWGQRRFMASQIAERKTIAALVELESEANAPGPRRSIEQLVENLHRADLAPLDRARAMHDVVATGMTQVDLARELGLAPATISNDLGLLEAPPKIQTWIEGGQLSPSHAKALKGLAPRTQLEVAKEAIERGYSAHRVEEEVQRRKQIAEREAQQQRENVEQGRKTLERLQASIAELATKKQPGIDAEIIVAQDYYEERHGSAKGLAEALTKAGFTKVRLGTRGEPIEVRPKGCDCTAWKARLLSDYSYATRAYETKLSVTKACIVAKHRRAASDASYAAERQKSALQELVRDHIKTTAAARVVDGAISLDRILAESVLWEFLGYRLPEWAAARGGSRQKPWATLHALSDEDLAAELAKEVASDFRDKAGYRVDWTALATELGLDAKVAAS